MPGNVAGKRARCPRCNIVFTAAGVPADDIGSAAIAAERSLTPGPGAKAQEALAGGAGELADVRIQLRCDSCGHSVSFGVSEIGTVQECPACGAYVDVPEVGRPPTTAEVEEALAARAAREWELQTLEAARQQAVTAKQIEQAQRALDRRDQQDAWYDELLDRLESVIARWEQLTDKAEHVIEQMAPGRGPHLQQDR
jgi:hypothetical protein